MVNFINKHSIPYYMSNGNNTKEEDFYDVLKGLQEKVQKVDATQTDAVGFYTDNESDINYLLNNKSDFKFAVQRDAGGGFTTKTNTDLMNAQRFLNEKIIPALSLIKNIAEANTEYIDLRDDEYKQVAVLYDHMQKLESKLDSQLNKLDSQSNISMARIETNLDEFTKTNNFSKTLDILRTGIESILTQIQSLEKKDQIITEKEQSILLYKKEIEQKDVNIKMKESIRHPYITHNLDIKNLEQLGFFTYDNDTLVSKPFESFEEILDHMYQLISKPDEENAMKLYSRESFFNFIKKEAGSEYINFSSADEKLEYNTNKAIIELNEITNWTDSSKCAIYGFGEFNKNKQMPNRISLSMVSRDKFERQDEKWKIMELWNYPEMLNYAGLFGGTFCIQMRNLRKTGVDFDPSSIKSISFIHNNYSDGIGMMMIASTEKAKYDNNALQIGKGLRIL